MTIDEAKELMEYAKGRPKVVRPFDLATATLLLEVFDNMQSELEYLRTRVMDLEREAK